MGWDGMGKNEEKMLEKAMEVAYSACQVEGNRP